MFYSFNTLLLIVLKRSIAHLNRILWKGCKIENISAPHGKQLIFFQECNSSYSSFEVVNGRRTIRIFFVGLLRIPIFGVDLFCDSPMNFLEMLCERTARCECSITNQTNVQIHWFRFLSGRSSWHIVAKIQSREQRIQVFAVPHIVKLCAPLRTNPSKDVAKEKCCGLKFCWWESGKSLVFTSQEQTFKWTWLRQSGLWKMLVSKDKWYELTTAQSGIDTTAQWRLKENHASEELNTRSVCFTASRT